MSNPTQEAFVEFVREASTFHLFLDRRYHKGDIVTAISDAFIRHWSDGLISCVPHYDNLITDPGEQLQPDTFYLTTARKIGTGPFYGIKVFPDGHQATCQFEAQILFSYFASLDPDKTIAQEGVRDQRRVLRKPWNFEVLYKDNATLKRTIEETLKKGIDPTGPNFEGQSGFHFPPKTDFSRPPELSCQSANNIPGRIQIGTTSSHARDLTTSIMVMTSPPPA